MKLYVAETSVMEQLLCAAANQSLGGWDGEIMKMKLCAVAFQRLVPETQVPWDWKKSEVK